MIKHKRSVGVFIVTIMAILFSPPSFAANPYGINYDGGDPLGENNVQIEPELISGLSPIIEKNDGAKLVFSNSSLWQNGYAKTGSNSCRKSKYIRLMRDNPITENNKLSFTVSNQQYTAKISINEVVTDGIEFTESNDGSLAIGVFTDNNTRYGVYLGGIFSGYKMYSDPECQELAFSNTKTLSPSVGRIFIKTTQYLYRNTNLNKTYASNGLYYGITDIDNAQSFKILNTDSMLSVENMYAKSAASLQDPDPEGPYKNMYVSGGNYIYSQHGETSNDKLELTDGGDVYVAIGKNAQQNGLQLVYGFANFAGSNLAYYAKQYRVVYESDSGGIITGKTDEKVIAEENPTGSEQSPKEGYEFNYWIADKDVILSDGKTTIKAGNPITDKQILEVIVNEDLKFTAIHSPKEGPAVPNTGVSTGESNASQIAISVIGITLGALIIGLLPHFHHKKLGFNKKN